MVLFQSRNKPPPMRIRSLPDDGQQQQDARYHRKSEAQCPGLVPLFLRQPADQDGDEDDIVDPENDFKGRQRYQGDPGFRVRKPFHTLSFPIRCCCSFTVAARYA
jgi:hypothetical protein